MSRGGISKISKSLPKYLRNLGNLWRYLCRNSGCTILNETGPKTHIEKTKYRNVRVCAYGTVEQLLSTAPPLFHTSRTKPNTLALQPIQLFTNSRMTQHLHLPIFAIIAHSRQSTPFTFFLEQQQHPTKLCILLRST